MGQYAMRRMLLFIPTLLLATVIVFALFWIVPCGPAWTGPFTCSTRAGCDVERLELLMRQRVHVTRREKCALFFLAAAYPLLDTLVFV
jgi:ABC-type microcin C transport system permease subunit YejB